MSKTLFYEIAASANGNRIPSLCKTLEITPSTATEIHLLGVDSNGDLCQWTWYVGTAAPVGTPAATDLAFAVVPAGA